MSCGVGPRRGSDLALLWLWLWCRLAAVAPIQPVALEPPYAMSASLERQKTNKQSHHIFTCRPLLSDGRRPREVAVICSPVCVYTKHLTELDKVRATGSGRKSQASVSSGVTLLGATWIRIAVPGDRHAALSSVSAPSLFEGGVFEKN